LTPVRPGGIVVLPTGRQHSDLQLVGGRALDAIEHGVVPDSNDIREIALMCELIGDFGPKIAAWLGP
jgi:hypothetical protein